MKSFLIIQFQYILFQTLTSYTSRNALALFTTSDVNWIIKAGEKMKYDSKQMELLKERIGINLEKKRELESLRATGYDFERMSNLKIYLERELHILMRETFNNHSPPPIGATLEAIQRNRKKRWEKELIEQNKLLIAEKEQLIMKERQLELVDISISDLHHRAISSGLADKG